MTDTEYTPIPAEELDAIASTLHDYNRVAAQANAITSIDEVMDALVNLALATDKAMSHYPRLLAEAREAKRLRGEVGRLTKDYATLQYVKDEIVRTQPQYIKDLQAVSQEQSQTIDQLTARVDELEGQLKRWQPPNDSKSFSQANSQGEGG